MSKISTKNGDKGKTCLFSQERVSKDSLRIDALGDIDELISVLSVANASLKSRKLKNEIVCVQQDLIVLSSEIATTIKKVGRLKRRIDENCLESLDEKVVTLESKVSLPKCFTVADGSFISSYIDLARAICRRAERKLVKLSNKKHIKGKNILPWINRLSDYLFLLSRSY